MRESDSGPHVDRMRGPDEGLRRIDHSAINPRTEHARSGGFQGEGWF
jgi:hypothetical protein